MTANITPACSGNLKNTDTAILAAVGRLGGSQHGNTLYAKGGWSAATLTLSLSPNGTDWYDLVDTLTANGFITFDAAFVSARLSVTGGGGGTSIDWIVL